ncbi:MAG: hypothetical protein AABW63_01100 [Nanoarchaeota archaeon]
MAPPFMRQMGLRQAEIGRQLLQQITQAGISLEIIYSFVIITISLMIYFGTREFYKLSSHKGIKYFRLSFLFFAISFFFRYFVKLFSFFDFSSVFSQSLFVSIFGFISLYTSAMAVFYLVYSVMWKKWNEESLLVIHLLVAITALIAVLISNSLIILSIYIVLFIFVSIVTWISYKESRAEKKKSHLHGIYILLFIFWLLNIIDLLIPNILGTFQLLVYLASIGIFLSILYKVLRKVG